MPGIIMAGRRYVLCGLPIRTLDDNSLTILGDRHHQDTRHRLSVADQEEGGHGLSSNNGLQERWCFWR